jgi:hypothetical protein
MSLLKSSIALACCCLFLWLACDFTYSTLLHVENTGRAFRTYDARYAHGLMPNFDGFEMWGGKSYKFLTNSLGFRDGAVRNVPLKSPIRRILLIGDSFTEALGVSFEDSFAGMLYHAGQRRDDKIEFLNAGVVSYSPVLYYKKIKTLLASGLMFDEVVVFSDLSDVEDEATTYFCFDDDPQYDVYKVNCPLTDVPPQRIPSPPPTFRDKLRAHFVVTGRSLHMLNSWLDSIRGLRKQFAIHKSYRSDWTIPTIAAKSRFEPLGIEGGIARSHKNMQSLADLLAEQHIPLTIVVYPWPPQLEFNDRNSRQSALWREFCAKNCKSFIDLFPVFFAVKDSHRDWYERLFIEGDVHYTPEGNRLVSQAVGQRLLNGRAK